MPARRHKGSAALRGVRVLSLAQNVPGPLAVSRLVVEGATAVKIEPLAGDPMAGFNREWYRRLHRHVSVERLDLKEPGGQMRLQALLASTDLLITSQRPSALGRLGITRRGLARTHTHLRWLNIIGDTTDPERAGHDLTYQAHAGLVGNEMPRTLIADVLGAEYAVIASLLLLRLPSPRALAVGLSDALAAARAPLDLGLTAPAGLLGGALPTYRLYDTREGRVAVAALEPHFRARLYTALGLPDGTDLSEAMRGRTARQWERWAAARDLPIARVRE